MYKTHFLPNTRIDVADALRGIAVAGIILYHSVEHFDIFTEGAYPPYAALRPDSGRRAGVAAFRQDVRHLRHALRTEFLHHERQPAAERALLLRPFRLAHVPAVRVRPHQRGFLRRRHPDALCVLWFAAHPHQLSALEVGLVHHRPAGHPARRAFLPVERHKDRPHDAL